MTDNTHKTQLHLVPKNGQPGWITLADIPDRGTTFIMQRYLLNKFHEEAGEVGKEVVHYTENRGNWARVEDEIVDLLAMTTRRLKEGDGVIGFVPPYLKGDSHD